MTELRKGTTLYIINSNKHYYNISRTLQNHLYLCNYFTYVYYMYVFCVLCVYIGQYALVLNVTLVCHLNTPYTTVLIVSTV